MANGVCDAPIGRSTRRRSLHDRSCLQVLSRRGTRVFPRQEFHLHLIASPLRDKVCTASLARFKAGLPQIAQPAPSWWRQARPLYLRKTSDAAPFPAARSARGRGGVFCLLYILGMRLAEALGPSPMPCYLSLPGRGGAGVLHACRGAISLRPWFLARGGLRILTTTAG